MKRLAIRLEHQPFHATRCVSRMLRMTVESSIIPDTVMRAERFHGSQEPRFEFATCNDNLQRRLAVHRSCHSRRQRADVHVIILVEDGDHGSGSGHRASGQCSIHAADLCRNDNLRTRQSPRLANRDVPSRVDLTADPSEQDWNCLYVAVTLDDRHECKAHPNRSICWPDPVSGCN